jgi:hypothetical protein
LLLEQIGVSRFLETDNPNISSADGRRAQGAASAQRFL